jgi:hypothetical protein
MACHPGRNNLMTADAPDTGKILEDIERAATRVRDYLDQAETDSEVARKLASNVGHLLDHWSYLRYCLENEAVPLPRVWAYPRRSGPAPDSTGPFGGPDEQLAFLRTAVKGLDVFLEEHPQYTGELAEGACGELAAKADHLAACAAAVDNMCSDGTLPAAWAAPAGEVAAASDRLLSVVADPRVTANDGAAAKAGWDLSATTLDTVIVTRAGVRVTIERLDPNQVFDTDPFGEGLGQEPWPDPF